MDKPKNGLHRFGSKDFFRIGIKNFVSRWRTVIEQESKYICLINFTLHLIQRN